MFNGVTITLVLFYISIIACYVSSTRILAVFPTPSISHQVVFRPLIQELVKRRNIVTIITTDPIYSNDQSLSNLTEIDVHEISYQLWRDSLLKEKTGGKSDIFSQIRTVLRIMSKIIHAQFNIEKVKCIIYKKEQFDLLLIEAYVRPLLALTHLFKIPTIQISSFGASHYINEFFGVPTHPFLYTLQTNQRVYNLSQFEKLDELHSLWRCLKIFEETEDEENALLKKIFGNDIPPIKLLSNNVEMLFLNTHPIWTNNQPLPPNVIHIRGIHNVQRQELPKELATLLNASKNGVVYFSLGTNVIPSNLPNSKIQMFLDVFSQLPYDVIWKWNLDSFPGEADNINFFKWLPQSDLLMHPNIKLFITQGGLQSTDEAIDAGVPLIGIPMMGDQWYNVEKYVHHKIGIQLDFMSMTVETLKNAIESVILDKSYKDNIVRLRTLMKDEPQTPLDRAVWWTEYVIRHGGAKHLRAAGANISWAQYLELELLTTVILVLISASLVSILLLYYVWKFVTQNNRTKFKAKTS